MGPLLLDLALVYHALAASGDGRLDASESRAMRAALSGWVPGADPAGLDHALREAALSGVGVADLLSALGRLTGRLDEAGRRRVLADLRSVAEADGAVTRGETNLMGLVAGVLGSAGDGGSGESGRRASG